MPHAMLTECKRLRTAQLGPLAEAAHLTLARVGMLFRIHLDVVLWKATRSMCREEGAVATVEDVDLWICELRVSKIVGRTVLTPNVLGPGGESVRSLGRITSLTLWVHDEQSIRSGRLAMSWRATCARKASVPRAPCC